jgi:hypothetical protein
MLKYNIILIGYLIMLYQGHTMSINRMTDQLEGSSSNLNEVLSQHLPGGTVGNHEKLGQDT